MKEYIEKYKMLGYTDEQAQKIISNYDKAYKTIDDYIDFGIPMPIVEISKIVGIPGKSLDLYDAKKQTDLQAYKILLDSTGIKYQIHNRGGNIKELQICSEHLYHNHKNEVLNGVSIIFNQNEQVMYFEGMSWE